MKTNHIFLWHHDQLSLCKLRTLKRLVFDNYPKAQFDKLNEADHKICKKCTSNFISLNNYEITDYKERMGLATCKYIIHKLNTLNKGGKMNLTNLEISTILSDLETYKEKKLDNTRPLWSKCYENGFDDGVKEFLKFLLTDKRHD